MRIKVTTILVALTAILVLMFGVRFAYADQDVNTSGGSAQVQLDFKVTVPRMLFLRVGTPPIVDEVEFVVTDIPEVGYQPTVAGDYDPPVRIGAIVTTGTAVTLSADSSTDMQNVALDSMPFSTIDCTGDGDFISVSSLAFDGTASQTIWSSTGKGWRIGTFNYVYTNSWDYAPGEYTGSVTYTLSSP